MSIKIKRNTGWGGSGSALQIKINGQKIAKINEKQTLELELPNEESQIQVTQFGLKSHQSKVLEGDSLVIKQSLWHKITFPLSMFIYFVVMFIPNLRSKFIIIVVLGMILILSLYMINGFKIVLLHRESSE